MGYAYLTATISLETPRVVAYFIASSKHCANRSNERHLVLAETTGSTFASASRRMKQHPLYKDLLRRGAIRERPMLRMVQGG